MVKQIIVTLAMVILLLSCHTTQRVLDSSMMSGTQNPAGATLGIGIAVAADVVIFIIDHDWEFGNGELDEDCEDMSTDQEITDCTGDIDPADPMED